ncbi:hypothetical protein VTK73DRAFT_7927 [Phialemonium thermophilum]|uniref:Protein kinase domain-containing protein n=1 Tax=Phialemonium thermophilum TaxID=223376 RepID=A0ABR3WC03_9PEZI
MGFEDPSVLSDYVRAQSERTVPRKVGAERTVYLSQSEFGQLLSFRMLPKIGDFGLAQVEWPEPLRYPIQPPAFQAPEVIFGTGWTYSADIWNLGVPIWNLLEGRDLFQNIVTDDVYDARRHLAAMVALLGPPPQALLEREERWADVPWKCSFTNRWGRPSWTAREFFGGPFFNSQGEFLHRDLVPVGHDLASTISSLHGDDKELFRDFIGHILQWLPEKRKTAKELLEHPWLDASPTK